MTLSSKPWGTLSVLLWDQDCSQSTLESSITASSIRLRLEVGRGKCPSWDMPSPFIQQVFDLASPLDERSLFLSCMSYVGRILGKPCGGSFLIPSEGRSRAKVGQLHPMVGARKITSTKLAQMYKVRLNGANISAKVLQARAAFCVVYQIGFCE